MTNTRKRWFGAVLLTALAAVASVALVASSGAAGPPLPKATNGNAVEIVGVGVPTPTAFAFTGSTVFAGSGPDETTGGPGGLFTVAGGKATQVPNTPPIVFGLAWKSKELYVSTGPTIVALSGWNGTAFSSEKTIYASKKKGFPGFNGLAFGPEGRLYAGLSLGEKYDHSADPFKPSQAVVSMTATGKDMEVVAEGIRQPFQLNFPKGSKYPYVDLAVAGQGRAGAERRRSSSPSRVRTTASRPAPGSCRSRRAVQGLRRAGDLPAAARLADGHRVDRQDALRLALRRHRQRPGSRRNVREGTAAAVPHRLRRPRHRARRERRRASTSAT